MTPTFCFISPDEVYRCSGPEGLCRNHYQSNNWVVNSDEQDEDYYWKRIMHPELNNMIWLPSTHHWFAKDLQKKILCLLLCTKRMGICKDLRTILCKYFAAVEIDFYSTFPLTQRFCCGEADAKPLRRLCCGEADAKLLHSSLIAKTKTVFLPASDTSNACTLVELFFKRKLKLCG